MGQYWKVVNLDKKQKISSFGLNGGGIKLWEMLANDRRGVGSALLILLAVMPERRGGGDLQEDPVIGSWAGDRVVVAGDYSEDEDFPGSPIPFSTVYDESEGWTDVTDQVLRVLQRELGDIDE